MLQYLDEGVILCCQFVITLYPAVIVWVCMYLEAMAVSGPSVTESVVIGTQVL